MTTKDLDDAIDRAVRDIMSAEPRPGFRGRVLDRLDRDSERRTRQSKSWSASGIRRLALPAFAGALLLAMLSLVVMQRRDARLAEPSPSTTVAARPEPPVTTPPPSLGKEPSTPSVVTPPVTSAQRVAPGVVQAASVEDAPAAPLDEDAGLKALNRLAPLGVAPIAETLLQTPDISIGELGIPPIVVEPLPLPGGGPVYPREDR
jgi:hypothetical protein